jgi:hypothetical protein
MVGMRREEPKTLAVVDLERLRQRLAGATEWAKKGGARELRQRMVELERERKPQVVIEQVEVPVLQSGQLEKLSEQSSLYFYRPCAPLPARVQRGTC